MAKNVEKEKQLAAKAAVKFIKDNQVVGLGTGSSANYAIKEIGEIVKNGLKILAVPTSNKTKFLAESFNIPLIDINSITAIDITIDGADEFTSDLFLIKGGGGALLKEKIVASITKEEIIIVDSTKKVDILGKFKLPIEVIPFASNYVLNKIQLLKGLGKIRFVSDNPFITDEGNYIIDIDFGVINDPVLLSDKLNSIEGIVAHGLFIKLASKVIMGSNGSTMIFV
ncbi:ribose-5-phosphate isomerase RpiA [Ferruginibacter paludis]|uniref:ribose-5-phosphate isomerase RpiA n=1 Tax=Ferruginibacter paludis TaxID=1310417 RepID=UPI0025B29968|nr:ribose-5-phosphate isomerase RpiA [Ferruginibacter paludis]MDN3656063.1 ribose-5-phosphate isomerase RpiA [Ferruginibacter paludis]